MEASGAWQRTVTAAQGREEEVCLRPGLPHTNVSQREQKRDWSPSAAAAPGWPQQARTPQWVTVTTRTPGPHLPPSNATLPLPFLLLTLHVDLSISGEAKDSDTSLDPAAASASAEEPGEVYEDHQTPRQTGWRMNAARLSRPRSLASSDRCAGRLGQSPAASPGGRKVTATLHAETGSYSRC